MATISSSSSSTTTTALRHLLQHAKIGLQKSGKNDGSGGINVSLIIPYAITAIACAGMLALAVRCLRFYICRVCLGRQRPPLDPIKGGKAILNSLTQEEYAAVLRGMLDQWSKPASEFVVVAYASKAAKGNDDNDDNKKKKKKKKRPAKESSSRLQSSSGRTTSAIAEFWLRARNTKGGGGDKPPLLIQSSDTQVDSESEIISGDASYTASSSLESLQDEREEEEEEEEEYTDVEAGNVTDTTLQDASASAGETTCKKKETHLTTLEGNEQEDEAAKTSKMNTSDPASRDVEAGNNPTTRTTLPAEEDMRPTRRGTDQDEDAPKGSQEELNPSLALDDAADDLNQRGGTPAAMEESSNNGAHGEVVLDTDDGQDLEQGTATLAATALEGGSNSAANVSFAKECEDMDDEDDDRNDCPICLTSLYDDERAFLTQSTNYRHVFHMDCIAKWLAKKQGGSTGHHHLKHKECPVCRTCMIAPEDMMQVAYDYVKQKEDEKKNSGPQNSSRVAIPTTTILPSA